MAQTTTSASQEFTAFYLQRTTQEFAEDLDKVREADDFKAESFPFLVHALQQGIALYSAKDQERVARPATLAATGVDTVDDEDVDMDGSKNAGSSSKKEKSKKKKKTSG
ncbi:hypothetical protein EsH8_VI_000748 [Colletotrichum jinshuiense]